MIYTTHENKKGETEMNMTVAQEWCNPININLKGSGYITIETPDGLMVLCNKVITSVYENGQVTKVKEKYYPIQYDELKIADKEEE